MMGDLDFLVRIKTEHPDPKALLEAYGRSVAHGCFRVPAKLAAGRPFVLTFLTKSNVAAIKGTAEVIGHEQGATWVRFLSAADPRRDADIVLTDVKVVIVPSTVVTKPLKASALAGDGGQQESGAAPLPDRATAGPSAMPAMPSARAETRSERAPAAAAGRPGSKIESAVSDVPQPKATGTGRSEALARNGLPGELAQPGQATSRDPRRATPLRSMPAISTAPANQGQGSGDDTAALRRPAERPSERALSAKRSAERPSDPNLSAAARRATDRQSGSAPAIATARARTGRRSAQHPAVRLVTPLSSESSPPSEGELSANRTMQAGGGAGEPAGRADHLSASGPSAPPPPHHLADPGYPMVVRTRGPSRPPSKHPRGLPVMPAIAAPEERKRSPSYPMHHVHPQLQEPSPQLRAVPMASSSGPLPEGTGQETAQPESGRAAGREPRQEVSGSMPLVSVVPWWTQPPERAATRSPVHDASALGSQHATAEAAVDFAEASGPDLARASSDALEVRGSYPRPLTMAEHAAPSALLGEERSGRAVTGAMPGPMPATMSGPMSGPMSAESQLIEAARRSTAVPAEDEPVSRRVMWGSIAIAVTCVAVAIGAVWWALELRASAQERKPAPAMKAASGSGSASASASKSASASAPASAAAPPASASAPASKSASAPTSASAPASPSAPAPASAAAPAVAAPAACQLRVSASANPASLVIDGQARGETPATVEVPCGSVAVELRRTRYAPATRTVEAKPGVVTDVDVRLARPVVSVRILSKPAGVIVRLNGKDLGKTPLSAQVPAFEHATLIWLAANGATKTQQIYPQQDGDSFTTIMGR